MRPPQSDTASEPSMPSACRRASAEWQCNAPKAGPKLPAEMRDLAGHIIDTKTGEFDPSKFEDRYENAVIELIKSKERGEPIKPQAEPPPSNVVNLMDALRRSIAAEKPEPARKAPSKRSSERAPTAAAKKGRPAKKAG